MLNLISKYKKQIIVVVVLSLILISGLSASAATYQMGDVRALFETTLTSRLSSTATSFNLTNATDKDGNELASSTYGIIIDEGTANEELILADCTGETCTNATRGLSVKTGTTTVSDLKFEHRRGSSVKITDAPILLFIANVLKGIQNMENVLKYSPSISTSTIALDDRNLVNVALLNDTAFGSVPPASESTSGFVELADQQEAASSTSSGSAARLVLPASIATSTYNAATAPLRVVMTANDGKIDPNFVTLPTTATYATSSLTVGSFSAWDGFFKQRQIITTTGTSTVAIPSGVNKLWVEVQGAGADGGSSASDIEAGAGGGAGGYSQEIVDVSATTSVQVYVGVVADRTTFGTIGSEFLTANGGSYGGVQNGGNGGTASGGDINITGAKGGPTFRATSDSGGPGADSMFGFGGPGLYATSDGAAGNDATGYGSGGGGCNGQDGNACNSGNGTQGIIIIRW